jgi:TRAP-type C4-dicarboxylate transport system substrate-binding protein
MKKKRINKLVVRTLFALIILWVWTLAPAPATGQTKPEYKWRFASAWTQKVRNENLQMFCDLVNKNSNGRIQITFKPSGLLGTHDEIFHAVREGSIEIGVWAPYVNLVPGGMLNWMPWTVGTFEEAALAYAIPDGILSRVMDDAWNEVGFKRLFNPSSGPYGLGNKVRPIKTPDDFKNLKLRVSASLGFVKALTNMGKGTGMTLQTIPWADLYNALDRGVVDGCWSLWGSLIEERHHEVLKYYTALDWSWDSVSVAMNKRSWDKLPPDLKDVIFRASKEIQKRDSDAYSQVIQEYKRKLVEAGLQIYYPTPAEREVFRKKADMLPIWDELCKPWLEKQYPGQNMTKKIQEELERVKVKASGKKP